jgi:hypothetical protein
VHDAAQEFDVLDGQAESLALPQAEPAPGVGQRPVPGRQRVPDGPHLPGRPRHHLAVRRLRRADAPRRARVTVDQAVIDGGVHHHRQRRQHPGRRARRQRQAADPRLYR